MASTTLPDCHWELCHRFMARYQHLFREGQVATLAHFFANTQLAISGHAHQTGQLLLELVRDQAEVKLEVENVENGVGEKAELESRPTEVTIKQEASEDGECAARKELEEPAGVIEYEEIADGLNLETSCVRRAHGRPQLKVRARAAPALAIVEQIVVHNDPKLNEQYDVFPPRGRSRRW
uniref:(northern house mosquito) hypothetical protein n=1 Tax=Culex pipiens TaxID=7175 RepID=A0A8D8HAR7_CULPI